MQYYPLKDRVPYDQLKRFQAYLPDYECRELAATGRAWLLDNMKESYWLWVKPTGEHRKLKAGEWFISGAIVKGYCSLNDTVGEYDVAELVLVQIETVYTEIAV